MQFSDSVLSCFHHELYVFGQPQLYHSDTLKNELLWPGTLRRFFVCLPGLESTSAEVCLGKGEVHVG